MLKRFRSSLTLRSFLLTFGLTALACAITYGALAYLTPISYTTLLEEELTRKSVALVAELEGRKAEDCQQLLDAFARDTGAYLRLTNGEGEAIYDTLRWADVVMWATPALGTSMEYSGVTVSSFVNGETENVAEDSSAACEAPEQAVAADSVAPSTYVDSIETDEGGAACEPSEQSAAGEVSQSGPSLQLDSGGAILHGSNEAAPDSSGAGAELPVMAGAILYGSDEAAPDSSEAGAELSVMAEAQVVEDAVDASLQIYDSIPLADGGTGQLVVMGGTRAVNQAVEAMKKLLPYLLIVILAISLLGAGAYSQLITRPIVSLSRIARRMAAQDFGVRWSRRRRDEIGVLGDSLNLLSENLSGALEQLREANAALQGDIDRERELDRQRTAFFAAASHELKTPVTILKGQLSGMLAQVGVYRDREKYLARALQVTARMEGLIQEILTISRIESSSYTLQRERVDLSALMEKLLAQSEELIDRRSMRIERDIAPGIEVWGSESLLFNAMDNVLMNAILYSPSGSTVRVAVEAGCVRVENTGASIPEAQLELLFQPFYRIEQSRNRTSGGSGLGLYLVQCILNLHGARCEMCNMDDAVRFTAYFQE